MATYEYRCFQCGVIERAVTSGGASVVTCSTCGREARRVYSPSMVYRTAKPVARSLEREQKSRDEPEVVTQVPLSSRQPPAASEHPKDRPPNPVSKTASSTQQRGERMPEVVFHVDQSKSMTEQVVPGHNRWHPDIPVAAEVSPGDEFRVECREWTDAQARQ